MFGFTWDLMISSLYMLVQQSTCFFQSTRVLILLFMFMNRIVLTCTGVYHMIRHLDFLVGSCVFRFMHLSVHVIKFKLL